MNIYTKPELDIIELPEDADVITQSKLGEKIELEEDEW